MSEVEESTVDKAPLFTKQARIMNDIWESIAFPESSEVFKDFKLKDYDLNRRDVKGMIQHFQFCKDYAADNAFLMATQDDEKQDVLRLNYISFPVLSAENDDYDEEYDENDISNKIKDLYGEDGMGEAETPIFPIESDDEVVLRDTKAWVKAVIADFGVCPFT